MQHVLSNAWLFISSVFGHWQNWLSGGGFGGVLVLATSALEKAIGRSLSKKTHFAIFGIAFFLCACMVSWTDEHDKSESILSLLKTKQAELDKLTKPLLNGRLVGFSIAPDGKHNENSVLTIFGIIKNQGAPTVLDDWVVRLRFSTTEIVDGDGMIMPDEDISLANDNGIDIISLHRRDYWPKMTNSNPIVTGGAATGWIMASFHGITRETVIRRKPVLTVSCADITGVRISFDYQPTGVQTPLRRARDVQKN